MITPPDRASALLFSWLALVWLTLELFLVLDWGRGPARAALLVVLGVLLWAGRRWAPRVASLAAPSGAVARAAAGLLAIGVLINIGPALFFLYHSHQAHTVKSDQARTVLDALQVFEHGANPYATTTVTDSVAYALAVEALNAQPACRANGAPIRFRVGPAEESVVPPIVPAAGCDALERLFTSLGFKYGPVTLFFYWPFVALFGAAGFLTSHLLLVLGLAALLYRWAIERTQSPFWSAVALLPLLWPTHLAWNVLAVEHLDVLPVFLVTLAWVCWDTRRFGAAAVCLGLSLAAKFLPAMLFLPLMATARRRLWLLPLVIAAACFAPFAAWDWTGLWHNLGYPFTRPPDSTALAFFLAPLAGALVRALALAATAGAAARAHLNGWSARASVEYLVLAHLAVFASGTTLHNNYLVWLLPLLSIFVVEEVSGAGLTARRAGDTPARRR
jgi:hypothetical protein